MRFSIFRIIPIVLCFILASAPVLRAGGGMWLPHLLGLLNADEMETMGMKISVEDIYSANQTSLKDAIGHFGGFCTSEVISDQGLLLTNHHCGYGQIQAHSSVEHNYLKDGFWAMNQSEELQNPGLFVVFIESIEDVSEKILSGVTEDVDQATRQSQIDENLKALKSSITVDEFHDVVIKPFYKGNQYIMFKTIIYRDIRLVGAPPESIGKFGSDTDNWVWPRHTGDFSLFRIYAGPNNEPANYDTNNKAYQPKKHLKISLDGVAEDDFSFVYGFPGSTNEYLPAIAVEQIANQINPARIDVRAAALNVLDAKMKTDEATRIKYASKYARIANYWKKWIGESLGINKTKAIEKKKNFEAAFEAECRKNPDFQDYAALLMELYKNYEQMGELLVAQALQSEVMNRNIESLSYISLLQRLAKAFENNGQEGYDGFVRRLQPYLEGKYKDFEGPLDIEVGKQLFAIYEARMPESLMDAHGRKLLSNLDAAFRAYPSDEGIMNASKVMKSMESSEQFMQFMKSDQLVQAYNAYTEYYNNKVARPLSALEHTQDELMRKYMKALLEVLPDHRFYPDANSTLRVTYGQVKGYQPKDGTYYLPNTYLEGVMEKYVPNDYEFDVPEKLRSLYAAKDYGMYAENGKLPVCFLGSNHTTGGNSGSPALDAYGNLIGLNFDRVWEGTMSDYNYDPSICRNIMVDVRYVLFIVDKFAGANHLIQEMDLVHPKN